ncbi:MAG: selenocysteine-specific translation elongation factor, partial [Pirellulales bacterium]|nr:selenocysteine-specific translation elongation factor [Pirellulales bacterium]
MTVDLILGTAGHIDHGKTALVKALTGVDTDRLPEEKRRGITIELGFAELDLGEHRLGIVDVPGHERFVRNMLAGATGVDLALLVVAADDSVKPQTREHLEILRLLELDAGVIALTKCDLPDPDWIDLVEQEVRELVEGTFLAVASLVRTSAITGLGMDNLRHALAEASRRAAASPRRRREAGPFRMAIDRAFTVAGYGTVATGSVSSGRVRVGDELVVEPGGVSVRVRGLENHARAVEEVHRGQRAAVNLAGIRHEQLRRGQELAAPGHLTPSRRLSVRLNVLPSVPRPLKHRSRLRLHVGTAEVMAVLVLLEQNELLPGQVGLAQLVLDEPTVTTWNQPLVVRSESPVATVGGGHVLDPDAPPLRRADRGKLAPLASLASEDVLQRASSAVYFLAWRDWQPSDLVRIAGAVNAGEVYRALVSRGDVVELPVSPARTVRVHREVLDETAGRAEQILQRMHQEEPLRP